jgi:hypothetical protein
MENTMIEPVRNGPEGRRDLSPRAILRVQQGGMKACPLVVQIR